MVYVDTMQADYKPTHRKGVTYVMSHMIADTEEELHAMAARIGVARKWYQGDHYDITQIKKAQAIKYGARLISWRQCGLMSFNRRMGYEMGTPETCEVIARKRRADRDRENARG